MSFDIFVVSPAEEYIVCLADGNPMPSVEWEFSNKPLSDNLSYFTNNYTLSIRSIVDAGTYICVARNKHGNTSATLNVIVQGSLISRLKVFNRYCILFPTDSPFFTTSLAKDVNGTAYSSIMLNCTAYGFPVPDIEWLKDGIPILNETESSGYDEKYFVWNATDYQLYEVTSYLSISVLNYDDNGKYQCAAYNELVTGIQNFSMISTININCEFLHNS